MRGHRLFPRIVSQAQMPPRAAFLFRLVGERRNFLSMLRLA
jgi:hypothetical protein